MAQLFCTQQEPMSHEQGMQPPGMDAIDAGWQGGSSPKLGGELAVPTDDIFLCLFTFF